MNKVEKLIATFLIFLFIQSVLSAQLLLQDDFASKNDYWFWRADGNQAIPTVNQGLLHLKLENAVDSQYCNTEIYDPTEPYGPGTQVRVRLKTSEIHIGSRGWGFWDGDLYFTALANDFDVAWVMQQGSLINEPPYQWFLFGVASDTITNRQTLPLETIVDETEWQTYKIVWDIDKVQFYINDQFIYETFDQLPNQNMRMDIWIDNRVINTDNPIDFWNNDVEKSEMFVDYVEISKLNGPGIERELTQDIILWESPNSFPNGERNQIWKEYDFNLATSGETLFFITGSAESYTADEDDDDLKIILNKEDFGWDSEHSFNGDNLNGMGESIVFVKELNSGLNTLQLISDVTPFLRDVLVLHSREGRTIFSEDYNEIIENDGLWKTIDFEVTRESNVTFLISGSAGENEAIWIELEGTDYELSSTESITDENLLEKPKTLVINEQLNKGIYKLKIYGKGTPALFSTAIYGSSLLTDINAEDIIPNELSLKASPNPFNPSTKIYFSIPEAAEVNIRIVNMLGQEIKSLVHGQKAAGKYSVYWNAAKESSGIYFCILETDNYFKVQKLLLLK